MKIQSRSRFDLRPLPQADEAHPLSEILIDGHPSSVTIAGAVLEACVECDDGFLVFASDDIPYEETLRIYLLNPALTVLDKATLSAPYTTGAFANLRIVDRSTLRFDFFGGVPWTLTLHEHEVFALPWRPAPRGVRRPFGLRRRFQLSGDPLPDKDG
ncbi:hypothetical protein IP92_04285 [Pseudoduganella flava]|uniref:Uncharacterized protein n=1 Tax=Pseudoduganella flava TaxID=871742 RepID=A0A562PJE5_9BURK|nr:hypothetical protein [Pseudoduganella flava]QGZ41930.1 hypothetical protein GO485_24655 [Pseudoduganella flava]TWI44340.1 hypothetical protein IP92_04285 [Pseudoduganella flava]